jgi:hypothetical protein
LDGDGFFDLSYQLDGLAGNYDPYPLVDPINNPFFTTIRTDISITTSTQEVEEYIEGEQENAFSLIKSNPVMIGNGIFLLIVGVTALYFRRKLALEGRERSTLYPEDQDR